MVLYKNQFSIPIPTHGVNLKTIGDFQKSSFLILSLGFLVDTPLESVSKSYIIYFLRCCIQKIIRNLTFDLIVKVNKILAYPRFSVDAPMVFDK